MKSPFNGEWTIDLSRSRQWDFENRRWIPDQIEREDLRLFIDGDIYDWDLWAGRDPAIRLSHSGVIDGGWAPYMCREIIMTDQAAELRRKAEADAIGLPMFEVNKPTAFIKLVRVNERFIYRISRSPDHRTPNYVLSTEVTADDELQGYVMTPQGQVAYYRIMTRVR